MTSDAYIIDGYVDEPACLGVPPYISPYIRYIAGVLEECEYTARYVTIDQIREDPGRLAQVDGAPVAVMIAGTSVPGKYLGGTPATLTEIHQIGMALRSPDTLIGGPITFGYAPGGGRKALKQALAGFRGTLEGSPSAALWNYLQGRDPAGGLDYREIDRWSITGSAVISQHPLFPHVMIELETACGCARSVVGGCAFCTEKFYGPPKYRSVEGIGREVSALHDAGARHFRLGRQPDLLVYQAKGAEFPTPRPDMISALFEAVRSSAPALRTLHIDNINPGTIAAHEDEARAALEVIVAQHTPGDVAAFGMETADPAVVEENNLKAMPGEVFRAIEVVCEVGGGRERGIPELLPGLNFVIGLAGETPETFALNVSFLQRVLESGLLVRRVNIRKLMPFQGTSAYERHTLGQHGKESRQFREWVRAKFDRPMLERVFPLGTVLPGCIVEQSGKPTLCRQLGSYPILAKLPSPPGGRPVVDAVVVGWGKRSVSALPYPIPVNTLPVDALRWIPGVGKHTALNIAARRPFPDAVAFRAVAGATPLEHALDFRPL